MAKHKHTPTLQSLEEPITVLFCLVDDAYARLNPRGDRYRALRTGFKTWPTPAMGLNEL
jgi:hypothetical protein